MATLNSRLRYSIPGSKTLARILAEYWLSHWRVGKQVAGTALVRDCLATGQYLRVILDDRKADKVRPKNEILSLKLSCNHEWQMNYKVDGTRIRLFLLKMVESLSCIELFKSPSIRTHPRNVDLALIIAGV